MSARSRSWSIPSAACAAKPLTVHATERRSRSSATTSSTGASGPISRRSRRRASPSCSTRRCSSARRWIIKGRTITSLPANHVVPAVGYQVDSGQASLVFTGDTTTNDPLWKIVNKISNLRYLIIETAFCNREKQLAIAAKHLCPSLLAEELAKLERSCGDLHHAPEAGGDRADDAGDRGLRRAVQAAHAAEQPGIRVLKAAAPHRRPGYDNDIGQSRY